MFLMKCCKRYIYYLAMVHKLFIHHRIYVITCPDMDKDMDKDNMVTAEAMVMAGAAVSAGLQVCHL
jgi:hypothetical protein